MVEWLRWEPKVGEVVEVTYNLDNQLALSNKELTQEQS
jgi:hypothetical protein